ncbi:hypothetical protein U1Q18_045416 [Sarracenia purpurea var. burkii]
MTAIDILPTSAITPRWVLAGVGFDGLVAALAVGPVCGGGFAPVVLLAWGVVLSFAPGFGLCSGVCCHSKGPVTFASYDDVCPHSWGWFSACFLIAYEVALHICFAVGTPARGLPRQHPSNCVVQMLWLVCYESTNFADLRCLFGCTGLQFLFGLLP